MFIALIIPPAVVVTSSLLALYFGARLFGMIVAQLLAIAILIIINLAFCVPLASCLFFVLTPYGLPYYLLVLLAGALVAAMCDKH